MLLARKAKIDEILKLKCLGGKAHWEVDARSIPTRALSILTIACLSKSMRTVSGLRRPSTGQVYLLPQAAPPQHRKASADELRRAAAVLTHTELDTDDDGLQKRG